MYPHPYSRRRKHSKPADIQNNQNNQATQNTQAKAEGKHAEAALDEALDESFPASDPIAISFDNEQAPPGKAPWHPGRTAGLQRQK